MRPATRFTVHALDRVKERLHLSIDELRIILDEELYVPLGYEERTTKQHRLFYSPPDRQYFVAVQDTFTGEVVTVLPSDYRDCSWKISLEACALAKEKLTAPLTIAQTPDRPSTPHTRSVPAPTPKSTTRVRLPRTPSGYVWLSFRAHVRRGNRQVIVGFWKDSFLLPDESALDRLVCDPKILVRARELLAKRLHDGDHVVSAYVIPGGKGSLPTNICL